MWTQIYRADEVKSIPAPFPDTKGHPTMQVLNADAEIGPGLLRLVMQPGDVIARHFHAGQAETLYILEGVFIDEGIAYPAGTELNVKPGTHHGPHTTETGTAFLAMFTGHVDLTDFKLSAGVEEKELAFAL
jgi:anti-sigma factor ChrR (cupin superfamily)